MNQTHLLKLLEHFKLGQLVQDPQRVHGGLLHIMWCIDTSNGSYFWGVLGNWINWVVYNIKRVIEPQNIEEKKLGEAQVYQVIPTILSIYKIKGGLINVINGL